MSYERRLEKENKKFELMLTKLAKAHSAPVLTCNCLYESLANIEKMAT